MRNPGGQLTITNVDGSIVESDTFTCGHCNRIVKVPPKQSPSDSGGMCPMCIKQCCKHCDQERHRTLKCVPFEKRLEAMERSDSLRRSILG